MGKGFEKKRFGRHPLPLVATSLAGNEGDAEEAHVRRTESVMA